MTMLYVISLHELENIALRAWNVELAYGSNFHSCQLQDPLLNLTSLDDDRIKWVLETYPTKYPFDHTIAQGISSDLELYGESLLQQLGLHEFIKRHVCPGAGSNVLLDISDDGSESLLHGIHWETIERVFFSKHKIELLVRRSVVPVKPVDLILETFTRARSLQSVPKGPPPQRPYNVLLVVSRSGSAEDIDPLLGCRMIASVIEALKLPTKVNLEITRPGTWCAFESHIKTRTEQWWRNGGDGPWFDVVHFDVHGTIYKGCGYLIFRSRSGHKNLLRSGEQIGQLLQQHHIPLTILHACESAKVTGLASSNLARILIGCGVKTAIAMSFEFTATAAEIFIRAFYFRFLSDSSHNALAALRIARSTLIEFPARVGRLDTIVFLPDYLVPVMYVEQNTPALKMLEFDYNQRYQSAEVPEGIDVWVQKVVDDILSDGLLRNCREQNVLAVEWLLLRENGSRVINLNGPPGVGKTTLVRYLGDWWQRTGLIRDAKYCSLFSDPPRQVIRYLKAWLSTWPRNLDREPRLFVLDDFNAVTFKTSSQSHLLTPNEKQDFIEIMRYFVDGPEIIIVVSRCSEDWLFLEHQQYTVPVMSNLHASAFAAHIMEDIGWSTTSSNQTEIYLVEALTSRLDYNPLSIEYFLKGAKQYCKLSIEKDDSFLLDSQSPDRPDTIMPDSPDRLLDYILLGPVNHTLDQHSCREAREFVFFLWDTASLSEKLALASLIPISKTYGTDWYIVAAASLAKVSPSDTTAPNDDDIAKFVSSKILGSGWIEFLSSPPSESVALRYLRIHPIFANCLRLLMMQKPSFWSIREKLFLDFIQYNIGLCLDVYNSGERHSIVRSHAQRRFTNLLAACALCYNVVVLNPGSTFKPIHVAVILQVLWNIALYNKGPEFSVHMLYQRMIQLFDLVEKRLQGDIADPVEDIGNNLDVMINTCSSMSFHFLNHGPDFAARLVERLIKEVKPTARRNENWEFYSRRWQFSTCLVNLGFCRILQSRFSEVKMLCSLALRCCKPDESHVSKVRDINLRSRAFHLIYVAAYILEESEESWKKYKFLGDQAEEESKDEQFETDFKTIEQHLKLIDPERGISNKSLAPEAIRQSPSIPRAKLLYKQGDIVGAKDSLLEGVKKSQESGLFAAEIAYQTELAEIAIELKDWTAAAQHIERCTKLKENIGHRYWEPLGRYDVGASYDIQFRASLYGSVFLRLGMLMDALGFFWQAYTALYTSDKHKFEPANNATGFIEQVKTVVRTSLAILLAEPHRLISPNEFDELDDIMQLLVMSEVNKRWPGNEATEIQIQSRLQRAFSVSQTYRYPETPGEVEESKRLKGGVRDLTIILNGGERPDQVQSLPVFTQVALPLLENDDNQESDLAAIEAVLAYQKDELGPTREILFD